MYKEEICNEDNTLRAVVLPVYGGMISQIYYKNRPLLHLDEEGLSLAPLAGGGMPVLFPFSSAITDDTWTRDGQVYRMPVHGLVKNDVFALSDVQEHEISLWTSGNEIWKSQYYPYDFTLRLTYRLSGNELTVVTVVENHSDREMPHSLGLHPFFYSSDKQKARLQHPMKVHYNYSVHRDEPMCAMDDLSESWDDVLHTADAPGFILDNPADGYRVICHADPAFQALVVCTTITESLCVEPWTGVPDSARHGRFLQEIPPREKREYVVRFRFEDCPGQT